MSVNLLSTARRSLIFGIKILGATVAIVAAFIFILAWFMPEMCGNEIVGDWPSPDGSQRVVVFERSCGATTGFTTQASLMPKNAAVGNDPGNLFRADTNHDAAPAAAWGGPDLKVEWEGNRQLLLSYHTKTRVFHSAGQIDDVTVRYATFER